ncbi:MAG TPA: spherulation-specific family 4 protein [Verrucomicrobiae bacterium]
MSAYSSPLGIMVPAYFSPGSKWTTMDYAASRIPLIAIMNPDSGPGTSQSSSYVSALSTLHQAGGKVIGYVYSSYGTRSLSAVETDINNYISWYSVDGFFVDEMTDDSSASNLSYYASIYQFVKSKGTNYSITGNPGENTSEGYITTPDDDRLMIFENNGSKYGSFAPSSWVYNYSADHFVHLPYGVTNITTMSNDVNLAINRNAGWVYISDSTLYSVLPGYWTNEVNFIQQLNLSNSFPTITDPTQPADQSVSIGSPATFSVSATSQSPLSYQWFANSNSISGATNSSYTISSVQYSNAGYYYVQIANSNGVVNSRSALLSIGTNTFRHIVIDGSFDDWADVPLAYSQSETTNAVVQFQNVYLANDDDYLYIRFTLYTNANPFTSSQNIFIDADTNYNTGNHEHGIGSDLLVQSGVPYQENSGVFNAGTDSNLSWLVAPAALTNDFELRISRNTLGTNGLPVLTNNTIAIILESSEGGSVGNEWFPSATGGLIYTFATQLAQLSPLSMNFTPGSLVVSWNGPGALQSCDSLANGGDWTNITGAATPYAVTPSNAQQFYRLIQN